MHSEVGTLRTVMVCEPGRAHQRLTPSNCDALLFDDVMWVETAKRHHSEFVRAMSGRGVEVLEMHDLLTETLAVPEARTWVLDQQVVPNQVGLGLVKATCSDIPIERLQQQIQPARNLLTGQLAVHVGRGSVVFRRSVDLSEQF